LEKDGTADIGGLFGDFNRVGVIRYVFIGDGAELLIMLVLDTGIQRLSSVRTDLDHRGKPDDDKKSAQARL
jgi:hypothetical protein